MTQADCWIRRIVVLLEVGGGTIGIVAAVAALHKASFAGEIILWCGVAYFLFGIISGLLLAESNPRGVICSQIYQFLQILNLTTPVISYLAMSGAYLAVIINGVGLSFQAYFGSSFRFSFLQDLEPWNVGVNFVALGIFIWLRLRGNRATNNALTR